MSRPRPQLTPLVVGLIAAVLFAATAARTITARYGGTDGAELTAVALSGGVAHPTGYPTYLLLARLALQLPLGESAARLALLSAVAAALAAALTAVLVADLSGSQAAGAVSALTLTLTPRLWGAATTVEVYALHLLGLTLCAVGWLRWLRTGALRWWVITPLALGLGLGVHLTLVAVLPAAGLAWWLQPARPPCSWRRALAGGALLTLGLSVYAWLPSWSARGAVPSWGNPTTLRGWWAHVSGAEYRYLAGRVPWGQRWARLSFVGADLLRQPGPLGLGLGAIGIGWTWQRRRPALAFVGSVALLSVAFAIGYGGADGGIYLLPWTWAWCLAAGLGWAVIWNEQPRARAAMLVITALALAALGWQGREHWSLPSDTSERTLVATLLLSLPPNALLLTADDATTFGGWYAQTALGQRQDVVIVDLRLLAQPWYQRQLARRLGLPGAGCDSLPASRRPLVHGTLGQPLIAAPMPPCADQ